MILGLGCFSKEKYCYWQNNNNKKDTYQSQQSGMGEVTKKRMKTKMFYVVPPGCLCDKAVCFMFYLFFLHMFSVILNLFQDLFFERSEKSYRDSESSSE